MNNYVKKAANFLTAVATTAGLSSFALADVTLEDKLYQQLITGDNFVTGNAGDLEITAYAQKERKLLAYEVMSPDGDVLVLNDYAPFGELDESLRCFFRVPFTGPIQVPDCNKLSVDLDAQEAYQQVTNYFLKKNDFNLNVLTKAYKGLTK